ncbi:MAG: hypothetical protein JWO42_2544 [Chloroflexi bacterium]|nr:hypothetical protein [Chloroflexota bacterium]
MAQGFWANADNSGFRTAWLAAVLAGFTAFIVFLLSLAPSITQGYNTGDSGELASTAYTLGISHPTGSPLYTMLGYLVTHLTTVEPARGLNMLSAVMGGIAVGGVVYLVCRLAADMWPDVSPMHAATGAGLAGVSLALSTTFWTQAVVTETRTLAMALDVLVLILLIPRRPGRGRSLCAALVYGLSLSDHLLSLCMAPAVIMLLSTWAGARLIRWLSATGSLLLGLSCYAYLPVRAAMHPAANWGSPDTMSRFLWVVTGREYRYQMLNLSPGDLLSQVGVQIQSVASHLNPLTVAMSFIGLAVLTRNRPRFGAALALTIAINIGVSSEYQADAAPVYQLLCMLCACIAAGAGWICLARQAARLLVSALSSRPHQRAPNRCELDSSLGVTALQHSASTNLERDLIRSGALDGQPGQRAQSPTRAVRATVLVVCLIAGILVERGTALDSHAAVTSLGGTGVRDFGIGVLEALSPHAIIVGQGDENSVPLWYAQRALGIRKDVTIVANALLTFDWYYQQVRVLPAFDPRHMPASSASIDDGTDQTLIQDRTSLLPKAARPGYKLFSVLPEPLWAGICASRPVGPVYQCVPMAAAP